MLLDKDCGGTLLIVFGFLTIAFVNVILSRFSLAKKYALKQSLIEKGEEYCPDDAFVYKKNTYLLGTYLNEREKFFRINYKPKLKRFFARTVVMTCIKLFALPSGVVLWKLDVKALTQAMRQDISGDSPFSEKERRWYRGGVLGEKEKASPVGAITAFLAGLLALSGAFLGKAGGPALLAAGIAIRFGAENKDNPQSKFFSSLARIGENLGGIGCVLSLLSLLLGFLFDWPERLFR